MKTGKVAGINSIHVEMLMPDILTSLIYKGPVYPFQEYMEFEENIPSYLSKGLIVKIPRKKRWRGIMLISTASKCSVEFPWTELTVPANSKLCEKQAGFWKGRGCTGQKIKSLLFVTLQSNALSGMFHCLLMSSTSERHLTAFTTNLWKILLNWKVL